MIKKNTSYQHRFNAAQSIIFGDEDNSPMTQMQDSESKKPEQGGWEVQFVSFGSGSSGNCSFIGTFAGGVLIDAGVDPDKVFADLASKGITPDKIAAIVLTHDHADHVRYAYRIVRKNKHIRIYATPKLMNGLLRHHRISNRIKDYHQPLFKEIPIKIGGTTFTAFETSHDASDNMGFMVEVEGKRFVVCTDTGVVTERARHYIAQAQYLMIESNYDREMLDSGRYPEYLKSRVRGPHGHLDNRETARVVCELYHPELDFVFLCHLSNDNNTPEIAIGEMRRALEEHGLTVGDATNAPDQRDRDVQVYALPRYDTSLWFVL